MPLWLRQITRIIRNLFVFAYHKAQGLILRLNYHYRLLRAGVSEKYIRSAISYLCQLDMLDFMAAGELSFMGYGSMVHIVDTSKVKYECVINAYGDQIVVHEKRDTPRIVSLEYDSEMQTYWYEVFRSGVFAGELQFVGYLKRLYGEGLSESNQKGGLSPSKG